MWEHVQREASVIQLFPQGNADPSGNLLLAGCRKQIALARHCKCSHELKMSSSYSSGLNWVEQIHNLHLMWTHVTVTFFHLENHMTPLVRFPGSFWTWQNTLRTNNLPQPASKIFYIMYPGKCILLHCTMSRVRQGQCDAEKKHPWNDHHISLKWSAINCAGSLRPPYFTVRPLHKTYKFPRQDFLSSN